MAKTEKIFYILEQVRLCLDRKDYIRCVSPACQDAPSLAPHFAFKVLTDAGKKLLYPAKLPNGAAKLGGTENIMAKKDRARASQLRVEQLGNKGVHPAELLDRNKVGCTGRTSWLRK